MLTADEVYRRAIWILRVFAPRICLGVAHAPGKAGLCGDGPGFLSALLLLKAWTRYHQNNVCLAAFTMLACDHAPSRWNSRSRRESHLSYWPK
jgi:hypothetical protein